MNDLKIPEGDKEKKAYKEGFKVGSRKVPMFPNLLKKSGRNQLKIVWEAEGGWKQLLPSSIDKSLKSPFMQGVKDGAKEYYSNKEKK